MISISPKVKALLFDVRFLTMVINGEKVDESNDDIRTAKYILQHLDTLETSFTPEDIALIRSNIKKLLK